MLAIKDESRNSPYKLFPGSITDPLKFLQEIVEGLKACGPIGWYHDIAGLPGFENIFSSKLEAHQHIWYVIAP